MGCGFGLVVEVIGWFVCGCCWLFELLSGWLVVLCRFDVFVDLFVFSYYMIVGLGVRVFCVLWFA